MSEKEKIQKKQPEDAEAYVAMAREKASPSGKIMERARAVNQQRLEGMVTELEVAQVENALKSVKGTSPPAPNESLIVQLLKGKSTEEIKQILENLTPAALANLQALSQAADPMNAFMRQQQQPTQNRDDLLIKLLFEERSKSTENLIQMIKLMKELVPAPASVPVQQASPPQNQLTQTLETIKVIGAMNEPFYKVISQKDKELMDLKFKEIEAKMPADPIEQVKYIKEMSAALGLGNAKNEIDLKLEAMKEDREIDLRRLDWEQEKYKMEQEADMHK